MNYTEKCEHCGHIKTAFIHNLNKQMVNSLFQLVNFYENNAGGCNLQKDLSLTKNQYNNFQKLQYFFLVQQSPNGWYPTDKGIKFIYGELQIMIPSITMDNNVLPVYHEAWKARKKKPRMAYVWEISKESWKKRSEYQLEKSNQLSIKI